MSNQTALEIRNLTVQFDTPRGLATAIDDVSLKVGFNETLAIVGESGCGKSVTAMSVLRLLPEPPAKLSAGEIEFDGQDLLKLSDQDMRRIRGNKIAMIFQEPMTSLNPLIRVGEQIAEGLRTHKGLNRKQARAKAIDILRTVQIPEPEKRVDAYPHELSGGMRQRVVIGIAIACGPKVLIADEPTTALDVTIQAQILDLMKKLQADLETAIVLITHDMSVVAQIADRVAVMYAGEKIEEAKVDALFAAPRHPYTIGLMRAIPRPVEGRHVEVGEEKLNELKGTVPSIHNRPKGCVFADRCNLAEDRCRADRPKLVEIQPNHFVSCWNADRTGADA